MIGFILILPIIHILSVPLENKLGVFLWEGVFILRINLQKEKKFDIMIVQGNKDHMPRV